MVVSKTSRRWWAARLRRLGLCAGLCAGLWAHGALAQPTSATTLAGAWLEHLVERPGPVAWSHTFALRRDTAAALPAERGRLVEELTTLALSARVAGNGLLATGLGEWAERLAGWDLAQARTPGRYDLPWLGANLRHDPPLDTLVHWGFCTVPTWVEVWDHAGVRRFDWPGGGSLDQLLARLPTEAKQRADHAALISPLGEVRRVGIAAWNHEPSELAPGSRIVLLLPNRQGLRGALPFPGTTVESDLVNERLPALVASMLPGEACTTR